MNETCLSCIHAEDGVGEICDLCHAFDKHCHIDEPHGYCEHCVHHELETDDIPCKLCWWINETGSDMWEADELKADDDDEFVPDYENKTKVYL